MVSKNNYTTVYISLHVHLAYQVYVRVCVRHSKIIPMLHEAVFSFLTGLQNRKRAYDLLQMRKS